MPYVWVAVGIAVSWVTWALITDRRVYYRLTGAVIGSFLGLVATGYLFMLFHPPTDIDRKCLNKTMVDMRRCVWEELKKKNEAK